MAEVQIKGWGTSDAPNSRVTKDSEHMDVVAIEATFDGSAAAGSFVPTVQIVSDSGDEVGSFPLAGSLAAGDSARVTFAPFLGSGGGIKFDQPNSGGYLDVTTTGADASGYGVNFTVSEFFNLDVTKDIFILARNTNGSQAVGIVSSVGNIALTVIGAGDIDLTAVNGSVELRMSSHFSVRDHNGSTILTVSDIRDFEMNLAAGRSFYVKNGAGATIFRIDNNGTIHGLASVGAVTWDL